MLKQRSSSSRDPMAPPADLDPVRPEALRPRLPGVLSAPVTKLLLVDFRSGETVSQHPDIQEFLRQGWRVKSAAPRLVEAGGTKLFVVLTQTSAAKATIPTA